MLGKLRESAGIAETAGMRLAARERAARADRYDGFDMNVRGGSDGGGVVLVLGGIFENLFCFLRGDARRAAVWVVCFRCVLYARE